MPKYKLGQSSLLAAALVGLLAAGFNEPVVAQVPVQESVPAPRPGQAPVQPGMPADAQALGGDPSRLSALFYQIQVLQQELQELRGLVEEQSHQLNRLARDQQEQYLDLDRRMQALRGGAAAAGPGSGPAATAGPASPGGSAAPAGPAATAEASTAPAGEREAYNAAFELMRQRQFEASVAAFTRFIGQYPGGDLTGNAYYWLGELHLVMEENEKARQAFAQVVNVFPNHQKVPDALYKLGVVYHRLGDLGRAREFLNRVRNQYPQSSAAGLAQNYLAEL
jgi:tol-pal system protein YbgF